jgi:hypothetical protein
MGEPPLQLRRTKLSLNYIVCIISTPDNSTIHLSNKNRFCNIYDYISRLRKPLGLRLQKEFMNINISMGKQPDTFVETTKLHSLTEHLKKITPNIICNNLFNKLIHSSNNNSKIYTDASKTLK